MIELDVTLTIGGTNYSGSVVSSQRKHAICKAGQILSLEMNPSGNYSSVVPWQAVSFSEQGTLVFTGYVTSVDARRSPALGVTIECDDTFKRALCTMTERGLMTDGETVGYWVGYLCGLAGISYEIVAENEDLIIYEDLPLELRLISDCLFTLSAYAGWVLRVDPDGVVKFLNVASEVSYASLSATEWEREIGDEDSRNECVVWGLDINTRTVRPMSELGKGRTMVFANAAISTWDMADYIAQFALNQFANLDDVLMLGALGNPHVQVGEIISFEATNSHYTNVITDLESQMNNSGYKLTLTMGRKCLRLPALKPSDTVVYVETSYYLARSYNFYTTSGSSVRWYDITPFTSGSIYYSGFTCFAVDRFNPIWNGYTTGSFGILRTVRLARSSPPWQEVVTPTTFNSATGENLLAVANVGSAPSQQGLVWAEGISTVGGVFIGRSVTSGSTWSWSSKVDTLASSEYTTGLANLGFGIDPANSVYFGGSNGALWKSSGSVMSFTKTHTVSWGSTTINSIATTGSDTYIGGTLSGSISSGSTPSGAPIYAGSTIATAGVTNPSYAFGAPDYTFATFTTPTTSYMQFDRPHGSLATSGSMWVRLYTRSDAGAVVNAYMGSLINNVQIPLSSSQRPTPWNYLLFGSSYNNFTLQVSSGSFSLDAVEFRSQYLPFAYKDVSVPRGHYNGTGAWGWDTNDYDQSMYFSIDNIPYYSSIEVSVTCVYERAAIPSFYKCDIVDISTNLGSDGGPWPALNSGQTRIFTLSVVDGSMGFRFYQGLARTSSSYRIDYVKVNGETIFSPAGGSVDYIQRTSGASLIDITPAQGGAVRLRTLTQVKDNPDYTYALPGTGTSIVRTTSGSTWTVMQGGYTGGCCLTQSNFNYRKLYWLDNNGIYYSEDGAVTSGSNKTGNWSLLYGASFADSGIKIIIVPTAVT
jgi:hypothetical protein